LWWTTDFILASPEGTPAEEEKWIVGEFNCSCVGISRCLAAYCKEDTPNVGWDDISAEDKAEAMRYGNMMGTVALDILNNPPTAAAAPAAAPAAEEKPAEKPAEEAPAEAAAEKPAEAPAEEAPAEKPAEDASEEKPAETAEA